ncbi:hypothetical protein QBC43DRAFT_337008 [Cladorrhinum sp. PSN259]|nr:hypothetical protein QBC43DRAFT_337008 [Cladorrhinum sp. PSN259]
MVDFNFEFHPDTPKSLYIHVDGPNAQRPAWEDELVSLMREGRGPEPPQHLLDYLGLSTVGGQIKDPLDIIFECDPEDDPTWRASWLAHCPEDPTRADNPSVRAASVRAHRIAKCKECLLSAVCESDDRVRTALLRLARGHAIMALVSSRTQDYQDHCMRRHRRINVENAPSPADAMLRAAFQEIFPIIYRTRRAWDTNEVYNPVVTAAEWADISLAFLVYQLEKLGAPADQIRSLLGTGREDN